MHTNAVPGPPEAKPARRLRKGPAGRLTIRVYIQLCDFAEVLLANRCVL